MDRILKRSSTSWELPVANTRVARVIVDAALTLEFADTQFGCTIRIESEFMLIRAGESSAICPTSPQQLSPVLALVGVEPLSAEAHDTGRLEIVFPDSLQVVVSADSQYEAWEFTSSIGARIVSMPGGGLTVWSEIPIH